MKWSILSLFVLVSCGDPEPRFLYQETGLTEPQDFTDYPELTFAHISDPHVMDPGLWKPGSAWDAYLAEDRKLLAQSPELLAEALAGVANEAPDFLVVSGDLTKDGEVTSHKLVAEMLGALEAKGVKVYVIPGNHDVLNPLAMEFLGETTLRTSHIDPQDFKTIYKDFGYAEALDSDPSSLSYVVEPVPGLWVVALDSAQYETNFADNYPKTAGRLRSETLVWAEKVLIKARAVKKAVMVTLHHGLVEHWPGQAKFHPQYLVDHRQALGEFLTHYGVRVVLTGHYHSQDVAFQKYSVPDSWLFDVECGSLVTYPNPYRLGTFSKGGLKLESRVVQSIPSIPKDFRSFSRSFGLSGLEELAFSSMKKFWLSDEEARRIAKVTALAFESNYKGNESYPALPPLESLGSMSPLGSFVVAQLGYVIDGLYTDSPGADVSLEIDLKTGSWKDINPRSLGEGEE